MSNVYEVRWRVLRARLEADLVLAEHAPDGDELARLASLGIALLERHRVKRQGSLPVLQVEPWLVAETVTTVDGVAAGELVLGTAQVPVDRDEHLMRRCIPAVIIRPTVARLAA